MVQLNFDATQFAPNTGFEPVPEGWYNVAITESEVKPTKDKEGAFLQLKVSIIDGPHANKPIFIRLNIQNASQQAVDIAYRELSSICHAIGVDGFADTSQLHGIPFQVRVIVRPAKDGYDASNNVKGYRDARGNEPGKGNAGGGQPSNFGGNPQGQGQNPNPQQGQNPNQGGNPGWGGQQGDPNPQGQKNPQGQGQPQGDPNQGQNPAQGNPQGQGGGNPPWGGGQPAQGQQQPPQDQGNGGWTQNPIGGNGAPNAGPAWGNNNGQ